MPALSISRPLGRTNVEIAGDLSVAGLQLTMLLVPSGRSAWPQHPFKPRRRESQGVFEVVDDLQSGNTVNRRIPLCKRPGSTRLEYARWICISAGVFWLCGSAIALLELLTSNDQPLNVPVIIALATISVAFGIYNLLGRPNSHAFQVSSTSAASMMIGLLMLASGGGDSPFRSLLFIVVAFAAYCMPVRGALVQYALVAFAFSSPLLYEPREDLGAVLLGLSVLIPTALVLATTVTIARNKLIDAEQASRQFSLRDSLTGVANLRALREWLALEMRATDETIPRAMLRGRAPAVILVDLDDFKRLNQAYGHTGGDQALCAVADALVDATRIGDCVARIDGDKFAVIAPEAGERGARFLAERCAEAIRATGPMLRPGAQLSASVGYALYPFNGDNADRLIASADCALRRIKAQGKDDIAGARFLASA